MELESKHRNSTFDYMKVIGVFSAMLVHYPINEHLVQILAFSVPLLVFLSGLLTKDTIQNYWGFIRRRAIRIIIPSYLLV